MGKRQKRGDRRRQDRDAAQRTQAGASAVHGATSEVRGWTLLAHPQFLTQMERLVAAAKAEDAGPTGTPGPNTKLLAHLLDLAFDKIPRDPGNPAFRHGGALRGDRKNWFRAKTGNGRYRLFYRFQSAARVIVYAWVNDENSLRTYGGKTDAYAVFAKMLDAGNPPDDWDALVVSASDRATKDRLIAVAKRSVRRSGP